MRIESERGKKMSSAFCCDILTRFSLVMLFFSTFALSICTKYQRDKERDLG